MNRVRRVRTGGGVTEYYADPAGREGPDREHWFDTEPGPWLDGLTVRAEPLRARGDRLVAREFKWSEAAGAEYQSGWRLRTRARVRVPADYVLNTQMALMDRIEWAWEVLDPEYRSSGLLTERMEALAEALEKKVNEREVGR